MKRTLLIAACAALMSLLRVSGQEITPALNENWTVHTVYTGATGNSLATDIIYYDGLGLKEQHIQVGASLSGRSIVKPFGYDSALREAYDYVAYETNRSTYDFQTNAIADLEEYCHNTFNEYRPFSYTRFEAHPEGRPIRVIAPGYAYYYSQHNPTIEYGTNTSSEVRIISSDSAGALVIGGSYAAGTLKKETVKDEDGRAVSTFKDKIGNLILERRDAGDTYYVYDDSFRLRYVITPKAASGITSPATYSYDSEFCKTNCYSYRYDNRRRVVVKRLPQCGEEYLVYDDCDRVIGRQSATDRESGVWRTYAYDPQGRLYREGSINSSKTREEFQNSPETTSGNVYNAYYYYDSYPASMSDDLGFVSVTNVVSSSDVVLNTNGLMTYKLVRDPYPSTGFPPKFHFTAYYYDYLGRMIQSVEKDPDGYIHRVSCKYDFTGNVTASVEEMAGVTKKTECTYDERGRLRTEKTYINGTLLSDLLYSYDIYGHITQRLENRNGLFNNYTYDIRGRQTAHTSRRAGTHIYSDELKYHSTYNGATATYSGNISAWSWKRHDSSCDTLMFLYDSSNRLIKAATLDNGVATNRFSENNITYDRNGNILTLKRYRANALKNNISNSYSGNQLSGCAYDSNGNMTCDATSGLTMEWNHLNLIKKVSDSNGVLVNYSYLADGTKVRAVDADGEGLEYRGSLTFRRSSDGTLTPESIAFSGGRIVAVTGSGGAVSFVVNHYVTDHLGSVRAVVSGSPGQVAETNDYYAFGGRWDRSGSLVDQSNRYRYNGKEEQATFGTPYSDYGARQYSSASGRWLAVDPLTEKYYGISPYAFCNNNPVNFVDPDGRDPIYKRTLFGGVKQIGDDGKNGSVSYLVKRSVAIEVKKASKANQYYKGDLSENDLVMHIPTGKKLDIVKQSYKDTQASHKENGGHSLKGSDNAILWDEGPTAKTYTDKDGNTVVKATLQMFVVNGVSTMPQDASNIEFWWHTHPNVTLNGISLGSSNPSEADYNGQKAMVSRGYKGNSFVIGTRTNTVTFFNNQRRLATVSWKAFIRMGEKE